MTKFTKEEISLCKQVAEKYRRKIKYGDWVGVWAWAQNHTLRYIAQTHVVMPDNQITKKLHCLNGIRIFEKDVIPLWTPSDCLEFLGEKFERLRFCDDKKFEVQIWLPDGFYYHIGNTPLEAYLKAVLGVLNA